MNTTDFKRIADVEPLAGDEDMMKHHDRQQTLLVDLAIEIHLSIP
jgi:hypothetical protein